jgi:hypothetical protein
MGVRPSGAEGSRETGLQERAWKEKKRKVTAYCYYTIWPYLGDLHFAHCEQPLVRRAPRLQVEGRLVAVHYTAPSARPIVPHSVFLLLEERVDDVQIRTSVDSDSAQRQHRRPSVWGLAPLARRCQPAQRPRLYVLVRVLVQRRSIKVEVEALEAREIAKCLLSRRRKRKGCPRQARRLGSAFVRPPEDHLQQWCAKIPLSLANALEEQCEALEVRDTFGCDAPKEISNAMHLLASSQA